MRLDEILHELGEDPEAPSLTKVLRQNVLTHLPNYLGETIIQELEEPRQ